jgi:transposase
MDYFWARVEPLIPVRQRLTDQTYRRRAGGGRKPKDPRLVFESVIYVLRTGCQWKAGLADYDDLKALPGGGRALTGR